MKAKERAYSSRNWKVATPIEVISLFWKITHKNVKKFDTILDMGAGDGRFAKGGHYNNYVGVEIETTSAKKLNPPKVYLKYGCVFEFNGNNYSACIGNPPYLRHNEISDEWREKIISQFQTKLGLKLDQRSNLYTYFILLGLQKTKTDGLVSLLIPYEWAFNPATKALRDFIIRNEWSVDVYRLIYPVFKDVRTTASISIINKANQNGKWRYFNIAEDKKVTEVNSFTDSGKPALEYEERGKVWAMRGLSPGTQKVFTLSEKERKKFKLTKNDVKACVTSFKELPKGVKKLDKKSFDKHFVSQNKKCWLIRTDKRLTKSLRRYVQKVPVENRNSWTCLNQKPWYRFKLHPTPKVLMSSAFKEAGPRILLNEIHATAVGSVIGIHTSSKVNMKAVHKKLLKFKFKSRIVPREEGLKKIAIKQVNAVLNYLDESKNGKRKQ